MHLISVASGLEQKVFFFLKKTRSCSCSFICEYYFIFTEKCIPQTRFSASLVIAVYTCKYQPYKYEQPRLNQILPNTVNTSTYVRSYTSTCTHIVCRSSSSRSISYKRGQKTGERISQILMKFRLNIYSAQYFQAHKNYSRQVIC